MQNQYKTLLLRQFLSNFFKARERSQQLNLLHSSLQVLAEMTTSFIKTHNINHNVSNILNINSMQQLFQQIYIQMKIIIEWAQTNRSDRVQNDINDSQQAIFLSEKDDQQLYGMLNLYKQQNSKLKKQIRCLKEQIQLRLSQKNTLDRQLQQRQSQKQSKLACLRLQCQQMVCRIKYLNDQLTNKTQQNNTLSTTLLELQTANLQCAKIIGQLQVKLNQAIQSLKSSQLQNKNKYQQIQQLKDEHQKQFKELKNKIPEIIATKLYQKQNWDFPVYQGLIKFLSASKKSNNY